MDELTQKKFDETVNKGVSSLTKGDIIFLKARKSYLNEEQLEKFGEVLKPKTTKKTA